MEAAELPESPRSKLDLCIGISVVLMATFLGVCSVKGSNISQKMSEKLVDRNDSWAWFQARNIREAVYEATADDLGVPYPNETQITKAEREKRSQEYRKKAESQRTKMKEQEDSAKAAEAAYVELGKKDDQFDLCEAALAIGLALMGVTALLKRWALFFVALVPTLFGAYMGIAGFMGMTTDSPTIKWALDMLA